MMDLQKKSAARTFHGFLYTELCSFKGIYDIISPFPMSTKVAAGKWGDPANDSTAVFDERFGEQSDKQRILTNYRA